MGRRHKGRRGPPPKASAAGKVMLFENAEGGPRIVDKHETVSLLKTSDGKQPRFNMMSLKAANEYIAAYKATEDDQLMDDFASQRKSMQDIKDKLAKGALLTEDMVKVLEKVAEDQRVGATDPQVRDDARAILATLLKKPPPTIPFNKDATSGSLADRLALVQPKGIDMGTGSLFEARDLQGRKAQEHDFEMVRKAIAKAVRYRFDGVANKFIDGIKTTLIEKPGQVVHCQMPAGLCFFEMPWTENVDGSGRVRWGFLYMGRHPLYARLDYRTADFEDLITCGSRTEGALILTAQREDGNVLMVGGTLKFAEGVAVWQDDPSRPGERIHLNHPFFLTDRATLDDLVQQLGEADTGVLLEDVSHKVAAICTVLMSPKVYEERPFDPTKLNVARARSNKPPLLSQRDVRIVLPKPVGSRTATHDRDAEGEGRHGVIRHFVMPFTRVKRGRVEFVSPHWRGDESLGVKQPRYSIMGAPAK